MRILICDDDRLFMDELEKTIHAFFTERHLKSPDICIYENGIDILKDGRDIDILFLDIEMPGPDGISVGKQIKAVHPNTIIFIVTSYIEYLDDAMRFHVFRYLTKPLDHQRLFRNLDDALRLCSTVNIRIPIETKDGIYTVFASDIIMIEIVSRKVIVHTATGDFISVHPMRYWLDILPNGSFFQSHKSFIVNYKHVKNFDHSLIRLYNNQYEAYLTRRKYTQFKERYLLYLESTR